MDTILTLNFWFDMARGPFVWLSLLIGFLGSVVMTRRVLAVTSMNTPFRQRSGRTPQKKFRLFALLFDGLGTWIRNSVMGSYPGVITVSIVFHVLLFSIPLLLLAHNMLLEDAVGLSLWSMPEEAAESLTQVFLACLGFFLVRRIVSPRVRSITEISDYGVLVMTAAPFVTGLLALHQIGDYKLMLTLHMLSGELMLLMAPFTKVYHMVFFFVGRFILVNEHTLGKGSRTW
ncbi:MAG: hypothetical protein V1793_21390 [Pseudomonadota bacterium]